MTLWRRELARAGLDPRSDVHRLDGGDRRHADARAPGQEFIGGAGIGPARVRVADAGIVQDSLAACGFETRSQIIWAKNNFAIGRGH